jgi:transposase
VVDKRFRDYNPKQMMALPPSLDEWLPEDHLVYYLSDVVDQFDLSAVLNAYKERRGQPPYHPRMLVKVWLYACCRGVSSSRQLERALHEDVGFRVLAANQCPDHWTLSEFRRRHHQALGDLLVESLKLATAAGLVNASHVSIDGTKIKGSASRRKSMRYDQLQAIEKRLAEEIKAYLERTEANDSAEDAQYGKESGWRLPPELGNKLQRLEAIRQAKELIEEEARRQHRRYQQRRARDAKRVGRKYKPKKQIEEVKPKGKYQMNLTDSDSRFMRSPQGFVQGYNAQLVVDSQSQIILAADATGIADDSVHLPELLEEVVANIGHHPKEFAADAGYWGAHNLDVLKELGIEGYIAPRKLTPTDLYSDEELDAIIRSENDAAKAAMMTKLKTEHGRQSYLRRMSSVEPVIGYIKEVMRFRQVLLRGVSRVRSFWRLQCAAFNLQKVHRKAVLGGHGSAIAATN